MVSFQVGALTLSAPAEMGASILAQPGSRSMRGGGFFGTLASQSVRGGGLFGSLASQAVQGGGAVASFSYHFADNNTTFSDGDAGFILVASAPASDMIIFDINAGVSGYVRLKLTSALHFTLEVSLQGDTLSLDSGAAIVTGTRYFVNAAAYTLVSSSGDQKIHGILRAFAPGGSSVFSVSGSSSGAGCTAQTYSAVYTWGVPSSVGYLPFPNSVGNEMSKMIHVVQSQGLVAMPTSDWTIGAADNTAFYNCRQTVGAVSSLTDGNGTYNLTAGAQGLTITPDGPFAS